ncbi:MAG: two-component regulator propeller domain-containing protein, partial [Ferruginibacter sp.]
ISKIKFDGNNHLWILNQSGALEAYAEKGDQFKLLTTYREQAAINNFFIINKQVFFTTANDSIYTAGNETSPVKALLKLNHSISDIVLYKNHYLLSSSQKGYSVYDINFAPSSFLQQEARQMQDVKITSWALGSEDILWFGTDGNGLIKVFPKTKSFGTISVAESNGLTYNKSVRAFCETDGNLWIGTKGGGIISIKNFWSNPGDDRDREYFSAPSVLDNNAVYALKKGSDGLIYIGTDGKGLDVYDLKERRFYKWAAIEGAKNAETFGSVYSILQDDDHSLWLGTSGYGLIHLKIGRSNTGKLSLDKLEHFVFNNSNTGPANDIIYSLANADKDHLWIGCRYAGLSVLDKRTRTFKTFKASTYGGSLSNNDVLSVFKDSKNRMWIGTSYGLNWINIADAVSNAPLFHKLTTNEGLPNNTIHAIEEDSTGCVWISTNKGLAKVDPSDMRVSYFQQMDGLQSNEFSDGSVWKDASGNIFFGGTYGFNHFLPKNIRKSGWQPNLLVSDILIGGKSIAENSFNVLHPGSNDPLAFSISRKDNFFEMDVKALSFLNGEKCEYAYFLEGYDKAWHHEGTNGKIVYSNILPGNYTLKIKWSNGEAVWTNEVNLLKLEVKQYFWLTDYAILVYAFLLAAAIYFLYRYRKNKLEIKHQLELEHLLRTKEEEIHQNRLGFFTNIAHELQTPLTLIMGSTERFLDKKLFKEEQKDKPYFLSLIYQQASRLTYLVQQLLEFRKVEAGFYENQFSYMNITGLLQNLVTPFISLSLQQRMQYEIHIDPGMIGCVDKDKLEKIVFNLLSNAFKHSGKKEQVVFCARIGDDLKQLEITVANSGINISTDRLEKIFNNFYTGSQNNTSDKFGTGIGLAFARQLVNNLNGEISAFNENDRVVFKVRVPLPEQEGDKEIDLAVSGNPSYLYQSITANPNPLSVISTAENNKNAFVENLQEDKCTILIVEDDPGIRFLLNDILKEEYLVYEAGNGIEALETIERILPDLVICDVMMPKMDGLELCQKMKDTPATCQVPFILLSAKGSEEQHMEGYESGADAYIAKPFHTAHLKLRIRKLIAYRKKLHELFKQNSTPDLFSETEIPDEDRQFLTRIVAVITEKLAESELTAELLEKEFCISKMQLYRKLKSLTGMTPGEFIRQLRLKEAARLLTTTNLTVSEIFFRTGFNNQSYFFREFKKKYHLAPNEYREQQSIAG